MAGANDLGWRALARSRPGPPPTFVRDRTLHPFRDDEPFASMSDLGPFEWLRDYVDHERFGHTNVPSVVEPGTGWIVEEPSRLLRHGRIDIHAMSPPSVVGYRRARRHPESVRDVGEIISLRDVGETNYYHFLVDLIGGRLRLAEELGVWPGARILVGRRLVESRAYFADAMRLMGVADDQVVVQDDRPGHEWWARAEVLHFADPPRHSRANFDYVRRVLSVPDSDPASARRLFLVREPRYGRGIANMAAVEEVARRFGFEILGTGDLGLEEQQAIFSEARYVVGVTGTALTNVIFRRNAPCSVLEIYPPGVTQPRGHFWYLPEVLGLHHDVLMWPEARGGPVDYRSDFTIDADDLAKALTVMLETT